MRQDSAKNTDIVIRTFRSTTTSGIWTVYNFRSHLPNSVSGVVKRLQNYRTSWKQNVWGLWSLPKKIKWILTSLYWLRFKLKRWIGSFRREKEVVKRRSHDKYPVLESTRCFKKLEKGWIDKWWKRRTKVAEKLEGKETRQDKKRNK